MMSRFSQIGARLRRNRLARLVLFMGVGVGMDVLFAKLTQDRMIYNAILALSLAWATEPRPYWRRSGARVRVVRSR